ncbi:MAG: response regulator transcription factor [Wujia sp.]
MNILLVEDSSTIADSIIYSFETNGDKVKWCKNVKETKMFLGEDNNSEVAILDIGLPDGNGFSLYEQVIKPKGIPTIFLTAKDDEDDIVKGLVLGAEDYVTKPFSIKELRARVMKIIARNRVEAKLTVSDISFDLERMEVRKAGRVIELSSLEIKILALLFENINRAVSRAIILDRIWEWTGNDVDDHTVTVYIKRIREKLGTDIITTIKGVGYRIDKDEQ